MNDRCEATTASQSLTTDAVQSTSSQVPACVSDVPACHSQVPACAGVVSLPVVKISDSDDVFVGAAESTAVVPDLAVFRRESAEDQKRDSGLFTALLRRRSTSSSAGERKHGGRDLLHDAFIGRARQRHDLTGCDETRSVGAQPVRALAVNAALKYAHSEPELVEFSLRAANGRLFVSLVLFVR